MMSHMRLAQVVAIDAVVLVAATILAGIDTLADATKRARGRR